MKLLHLFPDVMNLYGEYANVRMLERCLKEQGAEVQVDELHLFEEKDISGYDFYYMGAGIERNQKTALEQLRPHRDALKNAMLNGKVLLFTGNAMDLLGKKLTDAKGTVYEGLGLGDFESVEGDRRTVGDAIAVYEVLTVVGFVNKCSRTTGIRTPWFTMKMGVGNEAEKDGEGFRKNHCFGTHLIGPLLTKNPALLRSFVTLLLGRKPKDPPMLEEMEKSYRITLEELTKRLEGKK